MGPCRSKPAEPVIDDEYYNHPNDPEATTIYVGKFAEIQEHKFTVVEVQDGRTILLAKYDKKIFAIGDKCPHAGTSLADAPILHGRVRCLAHGACFDIESGDIEDFPGLNCIPTYNVQVKFGSVYVKVNPKRMPIAVLKPMARRRHDAIIVIIGGGPAGYSCAQTLREEGFEGRVIMVTQEKHFPYDRTQLSRVLNCDYQTVKLRPLTFYKENDIEVIINKTVSKISKTRHFVYFQGSPRPQLLYDNLFLALGQSPRQYEATLSGINTKNICFFRTLEDHQKIMAIAPGEDIVIAGSSFLSMELAEMLSPIAKTVNIISRSRYPYGPILGPLAASTLMGHFLNNFTNCIFHPTDEIFEFISDRNNELTSVNTMKRRTISCKMAVIAIGSLPNTKFLESTGMKLHPVDGAILVNQLLETSIEHIYAGGDAVSFPFHMCSRDRAVVGHWQMACAHGRLAALNMLGHVVRIGDIVPHFWTSISGVNVTYIGYGEGFDEILVFGFMRELKFCNVYRRRRRLSAVCCVGCERLAAELMLLFETEKEWIVDIPDQISKAFPGPPISAEGHHIIKQEIHSLEHDAAVNKLTLIPKEPFELENANRWNVRKHLIPIGFDLSMQRADDEEPDKTLASDILSMRRDQEDRRRAEILRYGKILGNVDDASKKK